MKSSQSNFNLRSPGSYLARSYLIATVSKMSTEFHRKVRLWHFLIEQLSFILFIILLIMTHHQRNFITELTLVHICTTNVTMNLNNKELMLMHILALSAARCHCRRRAARASKPNKFRTKNKAEKLWCGYKLRLSNYAYRILILHGFFGLSNQGNNLENAKH